MLRNGTQLGVSQWDVEHIPKNGDSLGFDFSPFVGTGGRYVPSRTLRDELCM